jgi:hypothetical protein
MDALDSLDLTPFDWDERVRYTRVENSDAPGCGQQFLDQFVKSWMCCAEKGHPGSEHYWSYLEDSDHPEEGIIYHGPALD